MSSLLLQPNEKTACVDFQKVFKLKGFFASGFGLGFVFLRKNAFILLAFEKSSSPVSLFGYKRKLVITLSETTKSICFVGEFLPQNRKKYPSACLFCFRLKF
jgi:hypothetical protein